MEVITIIGTISAVLTITKMCKTKLANIKSNKTSCQALVANLEIMKVILSQMSTKKMYELEDKLKPIITKLYRLCKQTEKLFDMCCKGKLLVKIKNILKSSEIRNELESIDGELLKSIVMINLVITINSNRYTQPASSMFDIEIFDDDDYYTEYQEEEEQLYRVSNCEEINNTSVDILNLQVDEMLFKLKDFSSIDKKFSNPTDFKGINNHFPKFSLKGVTLVVEKIASLISKLVSEDSNMTIHLFRLAKNVLRDLASLTLDITQGKYWTVCCNIISILQDFKEFVTTPEVEKFWRENIVPLIF